MSTLVYAPGVRVIIQTLNEGALDVTDDVVGGNVSRVEDAVSTASIRLANPNRKYDRVFTPNDSISIEMKRVRWMPVFTGYLNSVPYFSAWSNEVELTASCTLKRLQHFYWDPYAPASVNLLDGLSDRNATDGGIRNRVTKIMTDVVGWQENKIHIGEVPTNWFENISDLYDAEVERQRTGPQGEYVNAEVVDNLTSTVGAGASSQAFLYPGPDTITAIETNPATGSLPSSFGRVGTLVRRDESLATWGALMRWPYRINEGVINNTLSDEQIEEARSWWDGRKLVVVSPRTNRGVVVEATGRLWGPFKSSGQDIQISQLALATLGIVENEEVRIGFALADHPVGEFDLDDLPQPTLSPLQRFRAIQRDGQNAFPIPGGISSVSANMFAWGGFANGKIGNRELIPNSAGRPLHFLAAQAMVAMQSAAKTEANITLTFIGPRSGYRSFEQQVAIKAERKSKAAEPGESRHGWGLAADLNGMPEEGGFDTATYRWLAGNAHRFGWINPTWAQRNGSNPEPWHWEFWGIFGYPTSESLLNNNPYFGKVAADTAIGPAEPANNGLDNEPQLFNFGLWRPQQSRESAILGGPIALINDSPVMETLKPLINASMRKLSSAPNGDFIAWFPDYFGVYGTAGKMEIKTIELTNFTMNWSDAQLKTHVFVTGAMYDDPNRSLSNIGGPVADIIHRFFTMGVASIEQDKIMQTMFNIDQTTIFSRPLELLQRFGPRVHHIQAPTISSREAEFWLAIFNFQRNWAEQFSASVPMTFMPELYPGMLIQIPELGFQAYVTRVNHTFDFSQGFRTTVSITAPSSIGNPGLLGLPRAGVRESSNNYEGVDY
jgi:hypothetical protein